MVFVRKATSVTEKLAHYASFPQTPVSLHQMVAFGRDPSPGKVLRAAKFLADELPIRLAHRIRDIDNSAHDLGKSPSFATVRNWYLQSFDEISSFPTIKLPPSTQRIFLPTATPNPFNGLATPLERGTVGSQRRFYVSPTTDGSWTPELLELNSRFIKVLERVRRRHDPTVYRVAYGVREFLRKSGGNGAQGADEELHNWLDRFYMSRVSMRFLISQHMAISSPLPPPPHHVGIINERTDIAGVLQDAIDAASFICEEHYALHRAPRIILNCPPALQFAYVPGHLNHIAFEILKNSLRATVEKTLSTSDDEKFPDIRVDVIELPATDQIAIRVSDQGGGIKKEDLKMVWRYSYSTVGNEDIMDEDEDGMKGGTVRAPMAGYGYGLPLSRLYARYFGGDLRLESRDGEGTDATIILNRKACSLEPVH